MKIIFNHCVWLILVASLGAQGATLREEIEQLARSTAAPKPGTFQTNELGYLRVLRAPKGFQFQVDASPTSEPIAVARAFMAEHGRLFGADTKAISFEPRGKARADQNGTMIELLQTYAGLPVHGGYADVLLGREGGVRSVLANIRAVGHAEPPATTPSISAEVASVKARELLKPASPADRVSLQEPRLVFVAPVAGAPLRLAWEIAGTHSAIRLYERVHLDAHTGAVLLRSPDARKTQSTNKPAIL